MSDTAPVEVQVQPPEPITPGTHKGKIARMPKATRDKINHMLEDNVPYAEIIARLGPEGVGLTENNLSNWKMGGHQQWLRDQFTIEALRLDREFILELLHDEDPTRVNAAGLQLTATKLGQVLLQVNPGLVLMNVKQQPESYCALINAFIRLSDAAVKCEAHRANMKDRTDKKNPPPPRKIVTRESLREAEKMLHLL